MPRISKTPEPINWNQVKVLFEDQDKKISLIAEGVTSLRSEFGTFKVALEDVANDVKWMKPAIHTLIKDVAVLKTDVAEIKTDVAELKTDMKEVKDHLKASDNRLAMLEVKAS